jgi:hypothetical protein
MTYQWILDCKWQPWHPEPRSTHERLFRTLLGLAEAQTTIKHDVTNGPSLWNGHTEWREEYSFEIHELAIRYEHDRLVSPTVIDLRDYGFNPADSHPVGEATSTIALTIRSNREHALILDLSDAQTQRSRLILGSATESFYGEICQRIME